MKNTLNDKQRWEQRVYEIQVHDPVHGGPPSLQLRKGIANIPHLQLANRTKYLYEETCSICNEISAAKAGYESLSDKLESMIKEKKVQPVVIAKKGFSGIAPENTLLAFSQALDMEVRHLHADLNLSSDNVPVVYGHDIFGGYTNGRGSTCRTCFQDIKDYTYCIPSWRYRELHIPSLEEFLQEVSSQAEILYFDLGKTRSTKKIIEHIIPILDKYNVVTNTIFISDDIDQLWDIRDEEKRVGLALHSDRIVYKSGRNIKINHQMLEELQSISNTYVVLGSLIYTCVFRKTCSWDKYFPVRELEKRGVGVILNRDEFTDYEVQLAARAGLTRFLSEANISLTNITV